MTRRLNSASAAETQRIARTIGRKLRAGDVVTLSGELGAGKTTFAKGLGKALGVKAEVSSPTFVLIHEYTAKWPVYHLDWYRLQSVEGADLELAEECFEREAVTIIEWPERGRNVLPEERIDVSLSHAGGDHRTIEVRTHGKKYENFGV